MAIPSVAYRLHDGLLMREVWPGVADFLEAIRDKHAGWGRWPYHSHMDRPYGLISSAWGITLLRDAGVLDAVPAAQRAVAAAFLQDCQDPVSGYFKDPLVRESDRRAPPDFQPDWPPHSWEDIYGQMSAAEPALVALGATPRYPLPQARFADLALEDPLAFTQSLDWHNPWGVGERFGRAFVIYLEAEPDRAAALRRLEPAFAWLEAQVLSEQNGLASRRRDESEDGDSMAGLFKVMFPFLEAGRPLPYASQAIDSVLRLQLPEGEFCYQGHMCMNLDALWILWHLDRQLAHQYRFADIRAAGQRCADRLIRHYRKPDGGFSFHGDHCIVNHHSVHLCDTPAPIGDIPGTVMCLNCLAFSDDWDLGAST